MKRSAPAFLTRRQWLCATLWAGTATLAGCGFQLRGPMRLPFTRLRTGLSPQTPLGQALLEQLQASGVQLVPPPGASGTGTPPAAPPDVVLDVLQNQRERVVVGRNAAGQVRELQLRHRVKFRVRTLAGKDLIEDTELLQERDLSFSEDLALSKEAEEALLYRDMLNDIVRQIMYRLAALQGL